VLRPEPVRPEPVGYLNDPPAGYAGFAFVCPRCAERAGDTRVPVYPVNLRPYSQTCATCGALAFRGGVPTELYDLPTRIPTDPETGYPIDGSTGGAPADCPGCGYPFLPAARDGGLCPGCAAAGVRPTLPTVQPVSSLPEPDPIDLERYADDGGPCGRDF